MCNSCNSCLLYLLFNSTSIYCSWKFCWIISTNFLHLELNCGYWILSNFSGWTFLGNRFIFRSQRWHPPSFLAGGPQRQSYGRSRSLITLKVMVKFICNEDTRNILQLFVHFSIWMIEWLVVKILPHLYREINTCI